jgi:putative hydrolase of HD superfamily
MKTSPRLRRQIDFICEIDKVKSVFRHTILMDGSRRENDAEHGWHLALMALLFSELATDKRIDLLKVLAMVLIHDIVEIDCGDVFVYDQAKRLLQKKLEKKAARRIFGLLPADQARKFTALWHEFEARATPEARFAAALDRFQPVLHNYITKGKVWRRAVVRPDQVLTINKHIGEGAPALWDYVQEVVKEGIEKGYFKKSAIGQQRGKRNSGKRTGRVTRKRRAGRNDAIDHPRLRNP